MPFTYTYTARNKDKSERVITFTIFENYLRVNLTGLVDQFSEFLEEKDRQDAIKDFISTQSGSAIYKVLERLSGPVHVNDVKTNLDDGHLKITFWKRIAGLRFAPITLVMGKVDNPQAAAQFVDTLMDRQDQAEKPGFFSGPLDYWVSWIGLLIGLIVLIKWPKKHKTSE